jgi:hypothetical protein
MRSTRTRNMFDKRETGMIFLDVYIWLYSTFDLSAIDAKNH